MPTCHHDGGHYDTICKIPGGRHKKRTRKHASAIFDKMLGMRGAGVANDMVPACLASYGIYASVFIAAVDKKLKDAAR